MHTSSDAHVPPGDSELAMLHLQVKAEHKTDAASGMQHVMPVSFSLRADIKRREQQAY